MRYFLVVIAMVFSFKSIYSQPSPEYHILFHVEFEGKTLEPSSVKNIYASCNNEKQKLNVKNHIIDYLITNPSCHKYPNLMKMEIRIPHQYRNCESIDLELIYKGDKMNLQFITDTIFSINPYGTYYIHEGINFAKNRSINLSNCTDDGLMGDLAIGYSRWYYWVGGSKITNDYLELADSSENILLGKYILYDVFESYDTKHRVDSVFFFIKEIAFFKDNVVRIKQRTCGGSLMALGSNGYEEITGNYSIDTSQKLIIVRNTNLGYTPRGGFLSYPFLDIDGDEISLKYHLSRKDKGYIIARFKKEGKPIREGIKPNKE